MIRIGWIVLLALLAIWIAGCSPIASYPPSNGHPASAGSANPSAPSSKGGDSSETPSPSASASSLPLDLPFEKIQGDIRNIHYADGNQVFLSADKLYLYNLDTGRITAETSRGTFDQERVQAVKDGYVLVGATLHSGDGGGLASAGGGIAYSAIFYDRQLHQRSVFHFNTLLDENELILSVKAIAFTADGTQAAFATTNGLYLYDFQTKRKTTVTDLNAEDLKARSGVVTFEQIGFTNEDKTIAFKAQSFEIPAVPGKPSIDTCGTVNLNGSGMSNRTFGNYTCKELTAYNKLLLLAEDFTIPSGRMLVMEIPSGRTKLHALSEKGESGFVSGSDTGRYFATTLADKTGWKVRVYDTSTGKLEAEQRISSDGEAGYMANDPIVKVIDGKRMVMVLLGANQEGVKPKAVFSPF
jgi:hypothetical protein